MAPVFVCFLNSVTQGETRVPAELEMDAIMLLHGHVSRLQRLLVEDSWEDLTCKYIICQCNSHCFWFILPPWMLTSGEPPQKEQLSPAVCQGKNPQREVHREMLQSSSSPSELRTLLNPMKHSLEAPLTIPTDVPHGSKSSELLQKVCPAVLEGGCGYLPCTNTLIYPYICQPRNSWSINKYCITHVSGVHESHVYCPQKKLCYFFSSPGPIRLHFCEIII